MDNVVKGFKVFNPDWTCRGKQYTCPGKFEEKGKIEVCGHGMHFCQTAVDCFSYYDFDSDNKVAEVIAYGKVKTKDNKSCTNKLEIVREISWEEVLRIVNTGKNCTGLGNTGNRNTGYWNTGDKNTGYWNTGYKNTGDKNTGYWNTGNCNTGDKNTGGRNTGNKNTGNRNTGDCNTGDWNKSSFNTGCFMTKEQNIMFFNKPSDWTYNDWMNSDARHLLDQIPKNVIKWIDSEDMTDEEKVKHPTHNVTGGYLKVLDETECAQIWWDNLTEDEKNIIKSIPNFDAKIFEECTGIKVEVIVMSKNIIEILGQLVCTAGIAAAIEEDPEFQTEINIIFENYVKGDWGDTCIVALYKTSRGNVFIITESDRSVTTILFASEY